ncbi:13E12 repeat family protein [Mycobacterium tuberculosis TB_RSA58]|nr:13E12 repeat family protein [Mycobacterium tuberculosis TB_RSA58]
MDVSTRQAAEADLAGKAAQYRPDELARYAQRVMDWLHPDGDLTDTERARKRGITLSNQQYDGMSRLSGYLTPQARATFEAVLAKLAAPGATNPDDHTPVIDTTPDAAAIDRDTRSQAQRNHDGLLAGLRALIASGKLGQHNGLPVSIVVTTTLTDLQTGAGKGFTGGGTLLPMADVIRMTSHAHHYSPASGRYPQAIFDHGTPLALYHTKRLASPAQRIMLFANDRGCTKPGCDAPAYHSQAHHVTAWTSTGRTDITELTLACDPDNRLAEKGWTTHKNTHGHTEWLPPPHLDHGQPRERLRSLERLECLVRRLPAVGHALINQLDAQASEEELGGTLCCALANRLRITKPDAALRIADAADLGPRRALTGEPLAPQLTATATAQRQGLIGEAHIKVIRALFRPPARRGGCVHPPGRRSRPGRQSRSISSRRAGPLRPAGHGLATPRRRPHRHRTRPANAASP